MSLHHAVTRVQAHAFNARDLATLAGYTGGARVIEDGAVVGRGHAAMERCMRREWGAGLVGRVVDLDGEPVVAEYDRDGEGEPRGVLRFAMAGDRVEECRFEHDPATLARLVR